MIKGSIRKIWSKEIKKEAILYRKDGFTYNEIKQKLGIPKSTLNGIFKPLNLNGYTESFNPKVHLARIRILATKRIEDEREKRLKDIKAKVNLEINNYKLLENHKYLKSILAMLYWAEGTKCRGSVVFTNTDPQLALLFLTLLRKVYKIDENKLRVRLHLHYYHPINKTRKYWSDLLGISTSQFGKIYIKKRSITKRFRKNFAGICFIKYHSEDLRNEILDTGTAIAAKICAHSSTG